ncbi:P-loop containing nucleoside triphosphate hydrolase protein [Phaeosphaeriaceae sp. PMI808]|nr:P-loop containing nucleoside triphosphate hydrolase protein [Phaeosphaeriaceae sp. PMI808]
MDSFDNNWEDLNSEVIDHSLAAISVDAQAQTTQGEAPGKSTDEDAAIGNQDTESQFWYFNCLKHFLEKSNRVATHSLVLFIKKYLSGTKLIFVTGETGAGKSSLLEELTGEKLSVGHGLKSGTTEYGIWPTIIDGDKYLFVDTPGFGAADLDDYDVLDNIVSCLLTFGSFVRVAGVLFLHSSTKDRMEASELQTIRWLQCFCGPEFYRNITIITTKWDKHHPDDITDARERLVELETHYLAPLLCPAPDFGGAYLYNHGIPDGGKSDKDWETQLRRNKNRDERSAEIKKLIRDRYRQGSEIELQITKELKRKTVKHTEAAKALRGGTKQTDIRVQDNRAIVFSVDMEATTIEGEPYELKTTWEWISAAHAVATAFMEAQRDSAVKLVGTVVRELNKGITGIWNKFKKMFT